ncbi:hypothetical protein NSA50_16300 [Clostridium sp. DSM 100503]|uniref:hypothetical protein n=1 Tax=Clostridium sp. DSM 100503 TaxID=2963282 RepID=UPI002149CFC1|nr:hypothetical protein [Clostridium sp. DSM 100503]MCR1952589.1 hypothetical protein [Clostridium sp. DSM 100503]
MNSIIEINYATIIATVINLFLLFGIIILVYKLIKNIRNIRLKNKEIREKIDFMYNKLKD